MMSNFKITNYKELFGKINWQPGFEKELKGRPLEEQIRCYAWTTASGLWSIPFEELEAYLEGDEGQYYKQMIYPVRQKSIIVKDDLMVGVVVPPDDVCDGAGPRYELILPYEGYCYATTSDNNGAGYKETNWYKYLICLPFDHKLW